MHIFIKRIQINKVKTSSLMSHLNVLKAHHTHTHTIITIPVPVAVLRGEYDQPQLFVHCSP